MTLDVLYFAWLRERIGVPRERIDTDATTVAALIDELIARDDRHAAALSDLRAVRVAVDQQLVPIETSLAGAREVAFFPPMTGG